MVHFYFPTVKQLDCSGGQVPRCFWRNKASDRSKAVDDQAEDTTKLDGLEITQELWPWTMILPPCVLSFCMFVNLN